MQALKGNGGSSHSGTGLFGLRVAVVPDDGAWFAQGFDVDYFASGATPEEAKDNFLAGLVTMVKLHQKKFGTLERLRAAPADVITEYKNRHWKATSARSLEGVRKVAPEFRFSKVQYFQA